MSYLAQYQITEDEALRSRVTACAAMVGVENPAAWAYENRWELSAQDGWAEAYKAAGTGGEDEDAITDAMILTAVTKLAAGAP